MMDFNGETLIKLRKVDDKKAFDQLTPLFVSGETIVGVYKGVRDYVAFTNKRIISVNSQGVTGKKKDVTCLPYAKVQAFSIDTSCHFEIDSELQVWFSGLGQIRFEFTGGSDIMLIGKIISEHIL